MIEVTIWWGNIDGDSYTSYLVRSAPQAFKSPTTAYALVIDLALARFATEQPYARIASIKLREVPDTIIEPGRSTND